MKKTIFPLLIVLIATVANAQVNSEFQSEMEFFQSAYGIEKQAIAENFLKVPESSKDEFWTIYEAYETERKAMGEDRIARIKRYVEVYENISAEQADELVQESFKYRAAKEKLLKSYYKKIKKVGDATLATQFLQFELYLDSAIQFSLLEALPFIGE